MSKLTDVPEEPERDLLELTRDKVFKLPLLPQAKVVELFHELDRSLQRSIDALLSKTNFVEVYLADVVAEVAASVTHGRTIYSSTTTRRERREQQKDEPDPKEGTPEAVFKRRSDIQFLEQSINVLRLLSFYQEADVTAVVQYKRSTKKVLREIGFVRLVYEEVIKRFLEVTKPYVDLARQALVMHNGFHSSKRQRDAMMSAVAFGELHERMEEIEDEVQADRAYLYPLCSFIARNYQRQLKIRDAIHDPYLRVVYKEAKRHSTSDPQTLENYQNGSMGLIRAISCYNEERKVSFSSYAHWWVRQAILFSIKDTSNFMKLPVTTWQTFTAVEKKRAALYAETGDDSIDAVAEVTGHNVSKLKEMYESVRSSHVHSLDYEVDETGKMMLIDVIPDEEHEERDRTRDIDQDVETRLGRLPAEQRWLLRLHYGMFGKLDQGEVLTPEDIMQERIRQRIAAAGS